jgi:hypothetical protein
MSNARLRSAFVGETNRFPHVPPSRMAWGTSRFPTQHPSTAHWATEVAQ